jgi:hypothetical protein
VTGVLASLHRSLDRGEITEAQAEVVMNDFARWSIEHYSRLPRARAIMGPLLGERK